MGMSTKTEVQVKEKFRITIPERIREHLKMKKGDHLWYEITNNGKVTIGKIEVNKNIIE